MNRLHRACLESIAAVAATTLLWTATASAQTHLGQPASSIVTLSAGGSSAVCAGRDLENLTFERNLPNGTTVEFVQPLNQVLVVTEVDWHFGFGTADKRQALRLWVVNKTTPSQHFIALQSTAMLNSFGEGGTTEAVTTGFVLSPAATLCVDVTPGGGLLQSVLVRGYLASNK